MDITSSEPPDETPLVHSSSTGYEQTFLSFNLQNDSISEPIKELPPTSHPSELAIEQMLATLSSVDTAKQKSNHRKCSFSGPRHKKLKLSTAILAGTTASSISLEHSEVMRCSEKLKKKAVPIILRSRKMTCSSSSSINILKQPAISNFLVNNSNNSGALNEEQSNEEIFALSNHSNLKESEKNCTTEALNLGEYEKCEKCGKSVINTYKWQHVVNNHLKKTIYYCKYCNFTSNRTNNVLYHTREYHKGMAIECVSKIKEYEEEIEELLKECFCLKIPVQVHETPLLFVNTLVKPMIPVPVHGTPQDVVIVNTLVKEKMPVPVHETSKDVVVNTLVKEGMPVPAHETSQDVVNTLVKEKLSVPANETSHDVVNSLVQEKITVPGHETSQDQDVVNTLVKEKLPVPAHETSHDVVNALVKEKITVPGHETPQDVVNILVKEKITVPGHGTPQDVVNTLVKEKITVPEHETPQDVVDTLVKEKITVPGHETPQDVVDTLVKEKITVPGHGTPQDVVNTLVKEKITVPEHETPQDVVDTLVKEKITVPGHETPQDVVDTLVKEKITVPRHETTQDVVDNLVKEKITVPGHETPQDVVDTLVQQRMDELNTLVKQQETPQDVVNALVEQIFAKCQKVKESKKSSVEVRGSLNLDNKVADPPHTQTDGYCYCLKCHKLIGWNSRTEHVIQVHLEKPVYCCKYCNYIDWFVYKDILEHIHKYHEGMPVKYVDKIDQYDDEIKELMNECFCLKLLVHEKPPVCEVTNTQLNKQSFTLAQSETFGKSEKGTVEIIKVNQSNLDTIPTDPPQERCRCYCHKCQKSVSVSRMQHILHIHLGKAIYCCKYCDYTDSPANLFLHIHTFHEEMPLEYVNKTQENRDEIDQLLEECFGTKRCAEQPSVVKNNFCFKCQKSTTSKRVHLLQAHLKRDIYFCKYCKISNQYSLGNLLSHIRIRHKGMPLKYENKLGEYQDEISNLAQQCYGMQKIKSETSCKKGKLEDKKRRLNVKTTNVLNGSGLKCKRFYCLKCQNSSTIKRRHILQVHLKRDIYICKYCDYTTRYSKSCILNHVRHTHMEMPLEYKSMIAEYEGDIKKLEQECYGIHETSCKKKKFKDKKRRKVQTAKVHHGSALKTICFYCLKCQNSFTNKRRHLLQIHLKKDVYLCNYCDYTHQYSMYRTLGHIRHMHKELPPECTSRIEEYEDEIKKLEQACFGIRETSCNKRKLKYKKPRLDVQTAKVCHGSGLKSKLFYCLKCQNVYTNKRRHLLRIHLEKDIYFCKYCDYTHQYSKCTMLNHVMHVHKELAPECTSRIGEYEDEINKLEQECYGLHKMKHETCWNKRKEEVQKRRLNDVTANVCHGSGFPKRKLIYCLKCQKSYTNKRRHLLRHLQRDIYVCKYCDYANKYCMSATLKHVRRMHKEMPPEYDSRIGEYEAEIKQLEQECYGMLTMKREPSFNKRKLKERKTQKGPHNKNERFYCLKCCRSYIFTYKRLHILQAHLKKDIYFCKYCEYTHQYRRTSLLTHIAVHHKGMPVKYEDKLTEYKDEIDQLIITCYGSKKACYHNTCIWCNKRFKSKGFASHHKACESNNKSVNTKSTCIDDVGGEGDCLNGAVESNGIVDVDQIMAAVKEEPEPDPVDD